MSLHVHMALCHLGTPVIVHTMDVSEFTPGCRIHWKPFADRGPLPAILGRGDEWDVSFHLCDDKHGIVNGEVIEPPAALPVSRETGTPTPVADIVQSPSEPLTKPGECGPDACPYY